MEGPTELTRHFWLAPLSPSVWMCHLKYFSLQFILLKCTIHYTSLKYKVYNSMLFSTLTELCIHHHNKF